MIKEILRKIQAGKTLAEISEEMSMEYSALLALLEHLVKIGYLETRERGDDEVEACKTCPLFKVCSKKGPRVYYLTEKGKKAVK